MPWNLLIFPLVSGYFILTRCNYFKFRQQRLSNQRLIFESIYIGAIAGGLGLIIRTILFTIWPSLHVWIYELIPIKQEFSFTAILILVLSISFTSLSNKYWFNEISCAKKAIKDVGNELELILKSSFVNSKLLQFTLSNDKFYIGWVKELPIPSVSDYIRIIPAISGVRDQNKRLDFTTQYLNVYAEYLVEGKIQDIKELNTEIIIRKEEVISVSFFDQEMYSRFNRQRLNTSTNQKPSSGSSGPTRMKKKGT